MKRARCPRSAYLSRHRRSKEALRQRCRVFERLVPSGRKHRILEDASRSEGAEQLCSIVNPDASNEEGTGTVADSSASDSLSDNRTDSVLRCEFIEEICI